MKKLVIAAAIVCAAVFAQAASIKWSVSGAVGGEGTSLKNSTAYTFAVSIYTTSGTLVESGSSSDTCSGFGIYSATITDTATGTSYYAILSAASDKYELADSVASTKYYFTTDSASVYTINLTTGAGLTSDGHGTWSAGDWKAVPEPTSGLLMLLGMAGLALRRRRA